MRWLDAPVHGQARAAEPLVTADPRTAVGRTMHDGYLPDNGYFHPLDATGEVQIDLRVGREDAVRDDPAGFMPWIDEKNGLKFGIEFVRGVQRTRAVMTRAVLFPGWPGAPPGAVGVFHRWRRCRPGVTGAAPGEKGFAARGGGWRVAGGGCGRCERRATHPAKRARATLRDRGRDRARRARRAGGRPN